MIRKIRCFRWYAPGNIRCSEKAGLNGSPLVGPGLVGVQVEYPSPTDHANPVHASHVLMQGRATAEQMRQALTEAYPAAFANAALAATSAVPDIWQTRRIVGDYVLTSEDYYARSIFKDEIGRSSYWGALPPGESYGIPYRCFTPKHLTNVLVAGQAISCDQSVQASVRAMSVCLAMGESAGVAAAHAARLDDVNVHAVDVEFLRQRLQAEGAYFL